MIFLAELFGKHRLTGVETVFRFASTGYNHPTAPGFYTPRLVQPALFRRDIFEPGRTGGGSKVGWGEMVLANRDGGLDGLVDYVFDDQPARLLALAAATAAYGTATVVLNGAMEQVVVGLAEVVARIRDRQTILDKPIQSETYGGTNVPPNGVDGTADDIKGAPRPDCWGTCSNVEPIVVNRQKAVFEVNSRQVQGINGAFVSGVEIAAGVQRFSVADLLAIAPDPTKFDYFLGSDADGAYIRYGTPPSGRATVDLRGHKRDGVWFSTVADIIREIIIQRGGLAAADLVEADFTALNAAAPWPVGIWMDEEVPVPQALDALAASALAWWGFDRLGRFRLQRVTAPSGNPVVTFKRFGRGEATKATDADIVNLTLLPTNDAGRGVPAWQVKVGFNRCWRVQDSNEIAVSGAARGAFTAHEYRWATASDPAVKAIHAGAGELVVPTLLVNEADGQTLADAILALHGVPRTRARLEARVTPDLAAQIDLGTEVAVQIPRLGFDAGKPFIVTGLRYDLARQIIEADLWG